VHAVEAIRGWKMYETGWTKLCWPEAPITEGTVVGVLGRHFGLWSLKVHGGMAPCGRLGVLRGVRLRPPGPPVGQGDSAVGAPYPEAVCGRLPAEHGRSRRGCREQIKLAVDSFRRNSLH
jgi:hypothetical protein